MSRGVSSFFTVSAHVRSTGPSSPRLVTIAIAKPQVAQCGENPQFFSTSAACRQRTTSPARSPNVLAGSSTPRNCRKVSLTATTWKASFTTARKPPTVCSSPSETGLAVTISICR